MMNIKNRIKSSPNILLSYTAIMTALVFIFTVVFSLYIPETEGYFNIGETGVYIAAITGGPIVGALAGGIGSALSDIALGYTYYAPVTLIVKGLEGLIVGYLAIIFTRILKNNRLVGIAIGVILATTMYLLGNTFYMGQAEITLGVLNPLNINVTLNEVIWAMGAILTLILIIGISVFKPEYIGYTLSTVTGGLEMVLGYYLYEQVIYGPGAIAEVPFNIMQMIIGTVLGLSIVGAVNRVWKEKS